MKPEDEYTEVEDAAGIDRMYALETHARERRLLRTCAATRDVGNGMRATLAAIMDGCVSVWNPNVPADPDMANDPDFSGPGDYVFIAYKTDAEGCIIVSDELDAALRVARGEAKP